MNSIVSIGAPNAPALSRKIFKTSRLAEFCSQKELVNQTGHAVEDWPLVVLKELLDNALDAAEEAGIAPVIELAVSQDAIVVTDNGPGMAPETISAILDYTARVSSREAYVSPTRGAQGNALKTILAMGFVLDGERGETIIESQGVAHRIVFSIDRIRQEKIKTHGPNGRFGAVLFIEKEGFAPIFEAAELAEKFDIAIMSSKGMSVTAARMLADRMCAKYQIPLLTLHDFDIAGFSIQKTIGSDTRRYYFENKIRVIDLGLRLADVEAMSLESEEASLGMAGRSKIRERLQRNGATQAEIDFLLGGRRVELNAMPSDQFIEFVKRKLTENGIGKVVPDEDQLAAAFELFSRGKRIEEVVEAAIENMDDDDATIPDNLHEQVMEYLEEHPASPWEEAVRQLAE